MIDDSGSWTHFAFWCLPIALGAMILLWAGGVL